MIGFHSRRHPHHMGIIHGVILLFFISLQTKVIESFILRNLGIPGSTSFLQDTKKISVSSRINSAVDRNRRTSLSSSSDDSDLDSLRKALEESWNAEAMGVVPTTPEKGAEAAANAITNAFRREKNVLMVDLLLPSYDITQGENLYDEVSVAEFCIALAKYLDSSEEGGNRSAILVRDGKSERYVKRIVSKNDNDRLSMADDDTGPPTPMPKEEESKSSSNVIEYSDFDDFDGIGSIAPEAPPSSASSSSSSSSSSDMSDVNTFREQLMSNWNEDTTAPSPTEEPFLPTTTPTDIPPPRPSFYRIGSLVGDAAISTGPDMFDDVIDAVDDHAVQDIFDDILIVLSAYKPQDMIAIRRLVARYGETKRILLVNCKLDPLPRELASAETVYSILPLIARATVSDTNLFAKEQPASSPPSQPKIVVMRRFPRDWEVFVDIGTGRGFELVNSLDAGDVGKKGPPMDWIAGCVKRYMDAQLGGKMD